MKRKAIDQNKILAKCISDKEVLTKVYKEFSKLNNKTCFYPYPKGDDLSYLLNYFFNNLIFI